MASILRSGFSSASNGPLAGPLFAMFFALLTALAGCGGGGSSAPTPPGITTQPADQSVVVGSDAAFDVVATGDALAYQWQVSTDQGTTWTAVAGATSATLTLPAVTLTASGQWLRVVVGNANDSTIPSVTSRAAVLTVTPIVTPQPNPPTITSQPASTSVTVGQSATFSVAATGATTLSYQWQISTDGGTTFTDIAGATSASYTTPATAAADTGQQFKALVTDADGTTPSAVAVLTVTASVPTPTPINGLNQCFSNIGLLVTTGATTHVVYGSSVSSSTQTIDTVVNGPTTFQGFAAIEFQVTFSDSSSGALTVDKSYSSFDAATGVATSYGGVFHATLSAGGSTVVSDGTSVITPPWQNAQYTLAIGGTATNNYSTTSTTTSVTNGVSSGPTTTTSTASTTEQFVDVETITVPAGTYSTCKYVRTDLKTNQQTTHWVLIPDGIDIQSTGGGGGSSFAKSILINGVAR